MKPAGRSIPALVALCVLAAALAAAGCGGGDKGPKINSACKDDLGDDSVVVQVQSLDTGASQDQFDQTAAYLCDQIEAAGVEGSVDEQAGSFGIQLSGDPAKVAATRQILGISNLFGIYDWEPNLVAGPMTPGRATARAQAGAGAVAVNDSDGKSYVVDDRPALTLTDVESATAGTDPVNGEASVTVNLTPEGQQKFQALTKEVARRKGHFAVVYADQLLSLPELGPSAAQNGVDASKGLQLTGIEGPFDAEQLAKLIDLGPPPLQLFNSSAI